MNANIYEYAKANGLWKEPSEGGVGMSNISYKNVFKTSEGDLYPKA